MWNQGNYNLHKVFFPSRMMKVLISLYKCYIKSWLQNDSTIGSYDPYNYMFLFNKVKSQWWSPFVPQSLYITQVRRLKPRKQTGQFLRLFFAWSRPQASEAKPGSRAPSPPVSFQDHLLHHWGWGWGSVSSSFAWALKAVSGVWSPSRHMAGWCQWMEFFD